MKINKKDLKKILWIEAARRSIWDFCMLYDYNFFSKRPFLQVVADTIQLLVEKDKTPNEIFERLSKSKFVEKIKKNPKYAAISMPPRSGKSYTTSVAVAWILGKYNTGSVMRNTCTATLYEKFSYDTREIVKTRTFRIVFPDTSLSRTKQGIKSWSLDSARQVSYFGAGVGGSIIGYGASLLAITDDLYRNLSDALSIIYNRKVKSWAEAAHDSRVESGCAKLDIGTRWQENDYLGTRERKNEYDIIIRIPALIDGKSFCENVMTTEEYIEKKRKIDIFIWSSEYMQKPIQKEGVLFSESDFSFFKLENVIEKYKKSDASILAAIDTAQGGNDYYAMIIGFYDGIKIYIIDVIFNKNKLEVNQALTEKLIKTYKIKNVLIETNKEGVIYINILRKSTGTNIYGKYHTTNKDIRILSVAGLIKKYFVLREDIETNSEYARFLDNLFSYNRLGGNENDDAPDVSAMLMNYALQLGIIKL